MQRCHFCDAEIAWAQLPNGKHVPLEPSVLLVITEAGVAARGRQPHVASCPYAHRWPPLQEVLDAPPVRPAPGSAAEGEAAAEALGEWRYTGYSFIRPLAGGD